MTLPSTDFNDAERQVEPLGLEAGEWVAHLTDEDPESSTPELEQDFLKWVRRSPRNLVMFLDTYETYRRLAHIDIDPQRQIDIEELVRQCRDEIRPTESQPSHADGTQEGILWKRYSRWALAACAIVPILLSCYLLITAIPLYYSTAVGEKKKIRLRDGSELTLNTISKVEVTFTRGSRHVNLTFGEVFVKVHHDSRPFILTAGDVNITDLGTEFAVNKRANGIRVFVKEGVVRMVYASSVDTMVTRGEQADLVFTDKEVKVTHPDKDTIWTEGPLWFNDTALPDVIAEFNRYNARQFVIADPSIASTRVTAVFQAANPDKLLDALRSQGIFALAPDPTPPGTIRLVGKKQPSD